MYVNIIYWLINLLYKIIFLVLSKYILGLFEIRLNYLMLIGNYFNLVYLIIIYYDKNILYFF